METGPKYVKARESYIERHHVKLKFLQQMRPYSSVKAMLRLSCICFSVFGELGETGPR